MNDRPFPESYWVEPGRFLAGGYPGSLQDIFTRLRLDALLEAGFEVFFDLTRPGELPPYLPILQEEASRYGRTVTYRRDSIADRALPSIDQMKALLDAVDAALADGKKVYLHCWGGIGRTGTAVGCWLARHGSSGTVALERLNELYRASDQSRSYPRAPETDAQVRFILDWKESAPTVDWHARFLQQAAWTASLRRYLFERAGVSHAERVLEVGCGTGALLADPILPSGLYGLDLDLARLEQAGFHAPRAMRLCADALHLPFLSGSFDLVFCHFLLLWVRQPLLAILEMKRLVPEGGSVLALAEPDYEARLDEPSALAPLGRWQAASLRHQGADPSIGAHLADLFRQAGLELVETGRLAEAPQSSLTPADRQLEWQVLESDLAGFVPPEELSKLKALDEEAWQSGLRRLSVPTFFAWGRAGPMV